MVDWPHWQGRRSLGPLRRRRRLRACRRCDSCLLPASSLPREAVFQAVDGLSGKGAAWERLGGLSVYHTVDSCGLPMIMFRRKALRPVCTSRKEERFLHQIQAPHRHWDAEAVLKRVREPDFEDPPSARVPCNRVSAGHALNVLHTCSEPPAPFPLYLAHPLCFDCPHRLERPLPPRLCLCLLPPARFNHRAAAPFFRPF